VGVARIRQIIDQASERLADSGKRTVLFLDEIHRFTRAQQDVLLGDVERGLITLIGATTENPLFAINSALISRSTLLRFEPLSEADIIALLKRAINDRERGFGKLNIRADDEALALWAKKSDGDARRALTALEVAVRSSTPLPEGRAGGGLDREVGGVLPSGVASADNQSSAALQPNPIHLTLDIAEQSIQQKAAVYADDQHYDSASALIKSIRGSDPDAALYWCAHMLEGGEDPRFIARRLAILASEDIGNADPRAIMVAQASWELVERIGLPEARITLAQCITYLALAPKSNASYTAIESAIKDVKEGRTIPVPIHIKDKMVRKAGTKSAGTAGGDSYKYAHEQGQRSGELGMIGTQDYLGVDKRYYHPTDHGVEAMLKQRLEEALRARGKQP
jgi:putative ATPase